MQNIHFLQIFILIGAAQGMLLAVAVFKRSDKQNHNIFLAFGLLVIAARLAIYPFRDISESGLWLFIKSFSLISLLLVGPAIWLFIRLKTSIKAKLSPFYLLHLLPFLYYATHVVYPAFPIPTCYSYATLISGTSYGLIGLFFAVKFRQGESSALYFSRTQVRLYSLAFPLFLIPVLIISLMDLSYNSLGFHPATIPYLGLTVIFYRMGFKSMSDSRGFYKRLLVFEPITPPIAIDQLQLERLVHLVESEKHYLDQELTIQSLSLKTGFTRHEISELINKGLGKNFNEFINHYRVEEAKTKLLDDQYQHLSIAVSEKSQALSPGLLLTSVLSNLAE
ncbi:MAG: hypothetical protein HEP71_00300 [Roseivirga sp.]|nr:hypothetical protein [Roseivirga sp.]